MRETASKTMEAEHPEDWYDEDLADAMIQFMDVDEPWRLKPFQYMTREEKLEFIAASHSIWTVYPCPYCERNFEFTGAVWEHVLEEHQDLIDETDHNITVKRRMDELNDAQKKLMKAGNRPEQLRLTDLERDADD